MIPSTPPTSMFVSSLYWWARHARSGGAALIATLLCLALGAVAAPAAAQSSRVLSLEEALELLEQSNFDVRRAALSIAQVALLEEQAQSLWRPTVNIRGAYTFFDSESLFELPDVYTPIAPYLATVAAEHPELPALEDQLGAPPEPETIRHQHDVRATATVTQPLFNPMVRPLRAQAEAAIREAEAGRDEAVFALTAGVQELYFGALAQSRFVDAAERNLALAELNLHRVSLARDEQIAGEFEVNRAEVAVARATRDLDGARTGYRITIDTLAELLDTTPDFDVVPPPLLSFDGMSAEATEAAAQPETRRRMAEVDRLHAQALQSRRTALPTVALQGSAVAARDSAFSDPFEWSIQLGFDWNVYDGGRRGIGASQNEMQAELAMLRVDAVNASANAELRRAQQRAELATANVAQAAREVELAERNVEVTRAAWAAGAAAFVDVETAQQQRLLADVAFAEAETRLQAELYGWRRLVVVD